MVGRKLRGVIVFLVVLAGLTTIRLVRRAEDPDVPAEPGPAHLLPWELLGCYELEMGPWEFRVPLADALAGEGGPVVESASIPPILTPPRQLRFLPDSVDEWGRRLETYRVAPLGAEDDAGRWDALRWFVHADTLWVVWSHPTVQAGIALFGSEAGFAGRARALVVDDSGRATLDGVTLATAWKIDCATREAADPDRPRR